MDFEVFEDEFEEWFIGESIDVEVWVFEFRVS